MKKLLPYILLFLTHIAISQTNSIIQLNASAFKTIIEENSGQLLDVRTEGEYLAEHIPNAGQLNFYALDFKKKLLNLPQNTPIYLYCNTGYRSEKAAEILVKNGYSKVYNLEHGILEWNLQSYPVIEGDKSLLDKSNKLTINEFNEIIATEPIVFFDFYAPWCGPCQKMMPLIDSLRTEYHTKIKIIKINSDVSKKLVINQKVRGIPYFQMYKEGKLVFKQYGSISEKKLKSLFDKQLQN